MADAATEPRTLSLEEQRDWWDGAAKANAEAAHEFIEIHDSSRINHRHSAV